MGRKYRQHDKGIRAICDEVCALIGELDGDALQAVIDTPGVLTNSNCWWVSYGLAPALADIADSELRGRQWRIKKAWFAWLIGLAPTPPPKQRPAWAGPWRLVTLKHVRRWVRPIHGWDVWNNQMLTVTIKDQWHVIGPSLPLRNDFAPTTGTLDYSVTAVVLYA